MEHSDRMTDLSLRWVNYYMDMARFVSSNSKDKSTKVGCVIVGPSKEIRSTGYNGLPRGAYDDLPERDERPEKYFWYEHAERNAIYNAARTGIPLEGCHLFCTLCPCMDCARGIIQSGIVKVYSPKPIWQDKYPNEVNVSWLEQFDRTQMLLKECGVDLHFV